MGEIAEMMLDGTLCEGCGEFIGDACDFPRLCAGCARERREEGRDIVYLEGFGHIDQGQVMPKSEKVNCPKCNKWVKAVGLKDHIRDAHKE